MIWIVIVTTACTLAAVTVGHWLAGSGGDGFPPLPAPLSEFERRLASRRLREAKSRERHPAGKGLA